MLFKLIAALILFFMALFMGRMALQRPRSPYYLIIWEALSTGIFLGAALLHMLPDAELWFKTSWPDVHYPIAHLLCAFGFLLLLILSKGHTSLKNLYPLTGILSCHALIAGAALGASQYFTDASVIFTTIIAHKGPASFALGTNLKHNFPNQQKQQRLLTLFALMTPLGILITGITLPHQLSTANTDAARAALHALAAGTFLFLGLGSMINTKQLYRAKDQHTPHYVWPILTIAAGFSTMALLAAWLQ